MCPVTCTAKRYFDNETRRDQFITKAAEAAVAAPATGIPNLEKSGNSFSPLWDIEKIQEILPHRYPFLLVDRVLELEMQKYCIAYKNVTVNDNFFTGHFPERKIMPGVLQIEAMAQVGGICMMDPDSPSKNFFFGGIDSCKFRRPVVPGDTLMMKVVCEQYSKGFGIAKLKAQSFVGKNLVSEAILTLAMGK